MGLPPLAIPYQAAGFEALASRPHSPVSLALPSDWQEHPVLRHTAQELGRTGGPQQLEG